MHAYTQNGEEDTVLRNDLKRVKKKLFLTFAIAIIGTCVVFGILYYLGIDLLNNYIEGTTLIYYNEKPYIDEFQQYVTDNDISTTDVEQYDEWMAEHDVSFYSVQEEGKVIYNKSNVDKLISPAKNMYDYRFTGSYELPVQFADIEAKVFIYTGFTIKYYIALMIFDVGFSLMMGIVFVYLRIRKIIAGYQTELEASQEQEKKARQEKDELMRNMAHDLRTPLTGLMTHIDIMKLENEADEENQKYLFLFRQSMQKYLKTLDSPINLVQLQQGFKEYWKTKLNEEDYYNRFLPSDLASHIDLRHNYREGQGFMQRFKDEFDLRVDWEITSEFGLTAQLGRTLEKTGSSASFFQTKDIYQTFSTDERLAD